jgi:uncharacterized protein YndB with AHSA1/START domain
MPDILHRVGVNAQPDRVFKALSTIDGLRGWWVSETTGDAGTGRLIDFGFCQMQVIAAIPDQRVRWRCIQGPVEWVGTEVTFALVWKNEQTFIVFKHADWKKPVEFMYHCRTKWATFLLSLRDLLETADGHPVPHDLKIHVGD